MGLTIQGQDLESGFYSIEAQVNSTSNTTIILNKYEEVLAHIDSLKSLKKKNIDAEIYGYNVKAEIEYRLGEFYQSEKSSIESLSRLNNIEHNEWRLHSKVKALNQLGRLKVESYDYKKGIKHYQRVLKQGVSSKDKSQTENNIGVAYFKLIQYDSALVYYQRALGSLKDEKDKILIARILSNLGLCQSKTNDKNAFKNLIKAFKIRGSLQFKQGTITSHLHLSEYFKDKQLSKNALFHANKALDIAIKSKLIPLEKSALENVLSFANNDLTRRYVFLNDSLNTVYQNASNKFAEAQYNLSLKDREAQQVKVENDYNMSLKENEAIQLKTENQYQLFVFSMTAIFVILLGVILFSRIKQKNKIALIKESVATENRISARIHDELANDVYNTMVKVQNKNIKDPDLMNDIDHIYQRVRDISIENSPIHEDVEFGSQLNDLFLSYKNNGVNIITRHVTPVDWSRLKSHQKTAVYRGFQELLVNMKKHSQATHVLISFQKSGNKIKGVFKDNGRGCDLFKGNGLSNVETRIKSVNGTITFESQKEKGFTATIII